MTELYVAGDLFATGPMTDMVQQACDTFDLEYYEEMALTENKRIYIKALDGFAPYTVIEIVQDALWETSSLEV